MQYFTPSQWNRKGELVDKNYFKNVFASHIQIKHHKCFELRNRKKFGSEKIEQLTYISLLICFCSASNTDNCVDESDFRSPTASCSHFNWFQLSCAPFITTLFTLNWAMQRPFDLTLLSRPLKFLSRSCHFGFVIKMIRNDEAVKRSAHCQHKNCLPFDIMRSQLNKIYVNKSVSMGFASVLSCRTANVYFHSLAWFLYQHFFLSAPYNKCLE